MMVSSSLSGDGGALSGDFGKFVAEEQKAHACTLKQQRLYAEESHKRSPGGDGGGDGGGNNKNNKTKNDKQDT